MIYTSLILLTINTLTNPFIYIFGEFQKSKRLSPRNGRLSSIMLWAVDIVVLICTISTTMSTAQSGHLISKDLTLQKLCLVNRSINSMEQIRTIMSKAQSGHLISKDLTLQKLCLVNRSTNSIEQFWTAMSKASLTLKAQSEVVILFKKIRHNKKCV